MLRIAERGKLRKPSPSFTSAVRQSRACIKGRTDDRYCISAWEGPCARTRRYTHRLNRTIAAFKNSFLAYNCFTLRVALFCLAPWMAWCAASTALASLGKGNELMREERYQEAAAEFEQALHDDKTLAEARLNLAVCRFELRDYGAARKLLAGDNRPLAVYYLGRLDLLDGNLDTAIARFHSLAAGGGVHDEKYFLASAYCKKGRFAEAIAPLREWIDVNPRDFRAHLLLARALAKVGRRAEADQEFARTRELHEYYAQGSAAIGACRALLNAGKTDEAWAACRPMLETDDADKVAAIGLLFG